MSISQFLDLAYFVAVDERVRRGWSLHDALDDIKEFAARVVQAPTASVSDSSTPRPRGGKSVEEQNNEALQQLQAMMGGLGGGGWR